MDEGMKAKCPKCLGEKPAVDTCQSCEGTGTITAKIAEGDFYVHICVICGKQNGGCIVGGESPLKEPPKDRPGGCVFCGGTTTYRKADELEGPTEEAFS